MEIKDLSKKYFDQIEEKGISVDDVRQQINRFKTGFAYIKLAAPANVGSGIMACSESEIKEYIHFYNAEAPKLKVQKFVPASGAASRMFKDLFLFRDKLMDLADTEMNADKISLFFENLHDFAFFSDLNECMRKDDLDLDEHLENKQYVTILDYLLTDKGLNYGHQPKALLKFHIGQNGSKTALEEQLEEGIAYCKNADDEVHIHFTVSPEHKPSFETLLEEVIEDFELRYDCKFKIEMSVQNPATDMIAVDLKNEPFYNDAEELLFRPGGHGALLENLSALKGDMIFVKNIDNVLPLDKAKETYKYKKLLGGILLKSFFKIKTYLELLHTDSKLSIDQLNEIKNYIELTLNYRFADDFDRLGNEDKHMAFIEILNRPIRVCGMVKNEGEPGGGPFFVYGEDDTQSLQIVESSQIDLDDKAEEKIFKASTHFNPVDLVCYKSDYKGDPFELKKYRDSNTGFISEKSFSGRKLKAQELPGLWNGAMAFWNTIFVEVPLQTFNPVKEINDLLRAEHLRQLNN